MNEILKQVTQLIHDKEETPFHAGIWTRFFDDIQVMYGVGSQHVTPLIDSIKKFLNLIMTQPSEESLGFSFVRENARLC